MYLNANCKHIFISLSPAKTLKSIFIPIHSSRSDFFRFFLFIHTTSNVTDSTHTCLALPD